MMPASNRNQCARARERACPVSAAQQSNGIQLKLARSVVAAAGAINLWRE